MLARFPPPSGSTLCSLGVCSGCDLCAACIAFCPLLPATACLAGIGVLQADQRSALQQSSMRSSFPPAKTRYLSALEGDKGQRQRVLKAGEWYVAGESAWHPELLQTGDIIEFPVYEDDSSLCGNMIAKVTVRYKEDQFGRAFDATPLACSHKDFRRFMENDMKKQTCRFHLCRSDGSECDWECRTVKIYLHVDAFCRLMDLQAEKKIAAWSRDRKKTYDIIESVSVDASDADSEERPKGKVKLKARAASDEEVEASDDEPPSRRRETDATTREERAKGSLDEALGHLDTDAGPVGGNTAATSSRPSAAEKERADFSEKDAELKARLAGRDNAGIAAVNTSVLAERAAGKAKAAAVSSASSAAANRKVFPEPPNAPNKIPVQPKKPPYGSTVTKAMAYANEQSGRSADILAVRAALADGKTLTLQQARKDREDREKMLPPPSVPPKRVIPADAPPPAGRRVTFKPDAADDGGEEVFVPSKFGNRDPARPEIGEEGNFGDQFQDMKQKVPRMEGESRKAYKTRVHASIRALNKGEKPVLDAKTRAAQVLTPKARPVVNLKPRVDALPGKAAPPPQKQTTKTSFRAKIVLESRRSKETERRPGE